MSDKCTCPSRGYCPRRSKHIGTLDWRKCQAGKGAMLDASHAQAEAEKRRRRIARGEPAVTTRGDQPKPGEWPLWARSIARLRRDTDVGIGDTVQRVASWLGGELFKKLAKRLGIPCGCAGRQRRLNDRYPYRSILSTQCHGSAQ